MVININPNRINVPSGNAGRAEKRRQQVEAGNEDVYTVPTRAHVNYIPGPESLATLISSGIEALRRGIRWDRGTILNLLT